MDFYPENILLEIISLLNASSPPGESLSGGEMAEISFQDITFIWWLEYFLRTESAAFEERLDSLPRPQQSALAAQILCCFLHRPLMQRLFPSSARPENPCPWRVFRDGSLLQLIGEDEKEGLRGLYYLFPHSRLWPGLATGLQGKVFLTPEDLKRVQTAVEFSRQSRLDVIRGRAEGLGSFPTYSDPHPITVDKESPPVEMEPEMTAVKPKQARKKKKTNGQLSLFD